MNKEMIISSSDHDTRVAILEDDQVVEIFIERERSRGVVGNIYKGRVSKVLPGMQSSFIDIGLERDAFLYVSDISPGYDAYEGLLNLDDVEGGDAIRDAAPKVNRDARIEDLISEGQELLVAVADQGPGLPPGEEERIFEKFYQVSPGSARGAGLGLTICKSIIEAHGGRIRAANRREGGAVFSFTIPLAADAPPIDKNLPESAEKT